VGGFMAINGERSGQPLKAGVAVIDLLTGLQAAFAITAALLHRRETGEGQRVDLSLFETSLAALANQASAYLMSGDVPPRYGNAHPHIVPTDVFETADGPVMVCCGNTGQFRKLSRLLGHPELAEDPRFVTNRVRVEHRDELDALLREYLARVSGKSLVAQANEIALPVAHVLELDEVFEQPQVHARDMLLEIDHPTAGRFKQVGFPVKMGRTPSTLRRPPPRLGEHTREVLREAGLSEAEIDEMLGAESAAVA
jgi:crotonobetainyl-CoA:carnitine CoA-transferase CaiB-like acyl-CoA transferase